MQSVRALAILLFFTAVAKAGDTNRAEIAPNWTDFTKLAKAQQKIDLAAPDTNLLSEAVFHATNQQRGQRSLRAFLFHPGVRQAAAIQARIMRDRGSISHDNPELPKFATLQDRLEAAGLKFRFCAENVATGFGVRYEAGQKFYTRIENGKTIISSEPRGKAIAPHTYITFAEALVASWMKSPGHRKNILDPERRYLGASCLPDKKNEGIPVFYCVQVFFTPLD